MGFNPSSGKLSNATDTGIGAHLTLGNNQFLVYSGADTLWENVALTGLAALPTGGGVETISTNNAATGAVTLNLANGNVFNITMTGNVTFTFSGSTSGKACSFGLYLSQDGTGNRTVTWPASVKWSGGTAPTLTTTASATDILVFETLTNGTAWYGSLVGANFS